MRDRLTAFIVTPAPRGSRSGNRVTALRWAWRLRELGLRVRIGVAWQGEPCSVLIALHARRSHASIARHAREMPAVPRVVALTGTDLYGDIHADADARASLELATRLVLLQPRGLQQLPERLRDKARTIRQSASAPASLGLPPSSDTFDACVLGHLREVKDPLLAADAAHLLPAGSRVKIFHLGAALDPVMRARAEAAASASDGRWTWLGERSRLETLRFLAGARVLVLTSVQEGGANVVTEAIACRVPVLSTRIEGSLGILGDDYEGYFEPGDAAGLARTLRRCETDPDFLPCLRARCAALLPLVDPASERAAWNDVLGELLPERERARC